jgi:multidrug resistance efflux pump
MSAMHLTHKQPHQISLRLVVIVAAIVFAIVAIAAIFFATQFFASQSTAETADDATKQRIVSKVENLYILPEGAPTVARVQNKDQLIGQAFYDHVENGDYLIVYDQAKLALIYREAADKLVNVAPIALGDPFKDDADKPATE